MFLNDMMPDKQTFIDKIFPNGWQPFVVQFLAVLVLVIAFFFFLFKPVRKILRTRQEYVENNIHEAETKNLEANKYLASASDEITKARVEAQNIIVTAQKDAEVERGKALDNLEEEIRQKKLLADQDIEESKRKAQDEIKEEIINVAFAASEKILKREVKDKDDKRLVDDYLASLESDDDE